MVHLFHIECFTARGAEVVPRPQIVPVTVDDLLDKTGPVLAVGSDVVLESDVPLDTQGLEGLESSELSLVELICHPHWATSLSLLEV